MSDWKKDTSEAGAWEVTAGNFFADAEKSKGLRTTEDAKFYGATPAAKKGSHSRLRGRCVSGPSISGSAAGAGLLLQVRKRHCLHASSSPAPVRTANS